MKKICVVSGTRAEYGLLKSVIDGIRKSSLLELQLIVTGMHLSKEFGLTYKEIENDGFTINHKVDILLSSDTPEGISKSIGIGVMGFADALKDLNPDLLLILGDRYEIFAAATASMISRIPIAHIHGGEITMGAIDESIRHSLTKMSHLHFVAAEEYKDRVIQLGEKPDRVFLVGGLGVDNIKRLKLLDKKSLELSLDIEFKEKNLLITYHPVTLEENTSELQVKQILEALDNLDDTQLIFTMPNADTDGRIIFQLINEFVFSHKNAHVFTSLGQIKYLSCLSFVDGVLGNSSSGLLEVPSFNKGTINIGDRQKGRLKASSVIDCEPNKSSISKAIQNLYSEDFKSKLVDMQNPYGNGGASDSIINTLESESFKKLLKKEFHDINKT